MNTRRDIGIKICGMRDPDNIAQVASFDPDYLGFIAYPDSPRFIGDDFRMPATLPPSIQRVGVFVNDTTKNILQKTRTIGFNYVQLHGNETQDQCMELKDHGIRVIKVFSVDDAFDFASTKPFVSAVDYFLFDTKGLYFGGNAKIFNWEVLNQYDQEVPFFLSGGLSAENVAHVSSIKGMNIHALDINSGVEERPGMKSTEKLKALLTNLRFV